jgi:acetyl-CoA carboxylase biotin carboxyl carrier protein
MPKIVVRSTVAGSFARLEVRVGEAVGREQSLLIVEVMKMEIPVEAPVAGRVATLHVAAGEIVDEDQPLVTLET